MSKAYQKRLNSKSEWLNGEGLNDISREKAAKSGLNWW